MPCPVALGLQARRTFDKTGCGRLAVFLGILIASYVSNFTSCNEILGALSGAVVVLRWFWIPAFVSLLGAALNGE